MFKLELSVKLGQTVHLMNIPKDFDFFLYELSFINISMQRECATVRLAAQTLEINDKFQIFLYSKELDFINRSDLQIVYIFPSVQSISE